MRLLLILSLLVLGCGPAKKTKAAMRQEYLAAREVHEKAVSDLAAHMKLRDDQISKIRDEMASEYALKHGRTFDESLQIVSHTYGDEELGLQPTFMERMNASPWTSVKKSLEDRVEKTRRETDDAQQAMDATTD